MAHSSSDRERFEQYLDRLGEVIGHADRRQPLRDYISGLLLPGDRKSVEPMAARIAPKQVRARHQSMHHFVANAGWDAEEMIRVARDHALLQMERHAPVGAWIVDDSGYPKKGRRSVGVARQYCGVLGKPDNCQVVVTVSLANAVMSVSAGYRLYLPQTWAEDAARRSAAGVPEDLRFRTKPEIALGLIDALLADDIPRAPVVADAGYGDVTEFRDEITKRQLSYAVGIKGDTSVWPPGMQPLPPAPAGARGRPPSLLRRTDSHRPRAARELAARLPRKQWRETKWREGTKGTMQSRFAALRVRPAHRDYWKSEPRPVEWLLIEWPKGAPEPTRYWLSTVPEDVALDELVRLAKLRWRIERDYQELKDEIGVDHYEGRNWRGLHHHGALCIAAYAFLVAERARLSPPAALAFLRAAPVPKGFRPRGTSSAA